VDFADLGIAPPSADSDREAHFHSWEGLAWLGTLEWREGGASDGDDNSGRDGTRTGCAW